MHSNKFLVKQQGKSPVDLPQKTLSVVYRETSVVCKLKSLFLQQGFPSPTSTCTWTCQVNRDFISHSPRYTL